MFYWILLGITVYDRSWPSFTEFYWVLPSFTEFYLILPNFTEFYRVLPTGSDIRCGSFHWWCRRLGRDDFLVDPSRRTLSWRIARRTVFAPKNSKKKPVWCVRFFLSFRASDRAGRKSDVSYCDLRWPRPPPIGAKERKQKNKTGRTNKKKPGHARHFLGGGFPFRRQDDALLCVPVVVVFIPPGWRMTLK